VLYNFQVMNIVKLNRKGMTLVELMVAVLILGTVILVFILSFGNVVKSLFTSKAKTLASNLAQEKMQILKQQSYYKILITTSAAYLTEFSPPIPYDPGYFQPENILEGNIYFQRYTYVQVINEINGEIKEMPPSTPDTGMKRITITVVWNEGKNKKYIQVRSIAANPEQVSLTGVISGKVKNASNGVPIRGATVVVAENVGWSDITDANGSYSISLMPGTYWINASAAGFFPVSLQVTIGFNPVTQDFNLVQMASGTVTGNVWINDHIVISQVVASTRTPEWNYEYVELYNPTTYPWIMAYNIGGNTIPVTGIKYQNYDEPSPRNIELVYYTLEIPVSSYYLIANTTTVSACGVTKTADAVFKYDINVIKCKEGDNEPSGSIGIYNIGIEGDISDDTWIDRVGWNFNLGHTAPFYETEAIMQSVGFSEGEQYVRRSYIYGGVDNNNHPGIIPGFAKCYDSNNNDGSFRGGKWGIGDFADISPLKYPPMNSSDSEPYIAATPAQGAVITCTDGLSGPIVATIPSELGFPPLAPFAKFELTSVATGTWTVFIASTNYKLEISSVTMLANDTTSIPNNITNPIWKVSGYNSAFLENIADEGYITGIVRNAYLQPLSGIKVTAGAETVQTGSNGSYFISITSGIYTVVANQGNYNPLYSESIKENIVVNLGQVTSGVNFILSQCGRVRGFVTRDGINPVPGILMVAEDMNYLQKGDDVSGQDGKFTIINLSTGTYTIKPILSSRETSIPAKSTVTVTVGATVFAGTFTITNAFGRIKGKVIKSGQPIREGVLIIATTTTITGQPVTLSSATLSGPPYYISSSYEDGTYIVEVIGSTTTKYNVYAYYTTFSGETPIIQSKSQSNISVLPAGEVTGVNFVW